ncbi:hypothetical protein LSH36_1352g00024 [Paralvinella palmiformis]|uniref:Myosin motor domain-containing protein n=1 Tax=Paralvinella palmiformis TaxID=53620 RepID=A0AAD9MQW0_9ANNE|nr:hypothetical protein LSH36_1352g00024 [Paralvinella palmiformis]
MMPISTLTPDQPPLVVMSAIQRSISAPSLSKHYLVNKYFSDIEKNFKPLRPPPKNVDVTNIQLTPGQEVIYGGSKVNHWSHDYVPSQWSTMSNAKRCTMLDDLVNLSGPTTEDALLRTLQARFYKEQYYTSVGSVLVFLNPCSVEPSHEALKQDHSGSDVKLFRFLDHSLQKLAETCCPQAIVLSGHSGSGKTFTSMLLLQELFDRTNGRNSAIYQYVNAGLTVLQKLTSAMNEHCQNSSRMCRVTSCEERESNFVIFYEMLMGLSMQEKEEYDLMGCDINSFDCLSGSQHMSLDRRKLMESFKRWKACLTVLGIPQGDIIKILVTVLLLSNISFEDTSSLKLRVNGETVLQTVSALLQVPLHTLYKGLTSKSCQSRGQVYMTSLDAARANNNLKLLAQSLYSRTVAAIVKRANNSHRCISSQIDNNSPGLLSRKGPGRLSNGSSSHKRSPSGSRGSSHMHTRQLPGDNFLAILDMFGFEKLENNTLEQLCINLSSETLQHFYNTFVFKTTEESYIEEGIQADMDIHYYENAPIVELLSSQKTGVLSLLEAECALHNYSADTYLQKIRIQHAKDKQFKECSSQVGCFIISHFAGPVTYRAQSLMEKNKQMISDDIVWLFSRSNCSFGFVTHLFTQELKQMQDNGSAPKGHSYKLTAHYNFSQDTCFDRSRSCVSQDFHIHLDCLLKTLVQTEPHFIRCLKTNSGQRRNVFEREVILQQVRTYQILETLHLMTAGFPHRLRYKAFNARYRLLHPDLIHNRIKTRGDNCYAESKQILELLATLDDQPQINTQWALGKKNIFLSESMLQLLERFREEKRCQCATKIQAAWRCHRYVKAWPVLKRQLQLLKRHSSRGSRKLASVQPRSRTLSAGNLQFTVSPEKRALRNSFTDLRFEQNKPPDVPMRRRYTIQGNRKISYPQMRVMRENYSEPGRFSLSEGQEVKVLGASKRKGYLDVEYNNMVIMVPFQLTELLTKKNQVVANV